MLPSNALFNMLQIIVHEHMAALWLMRLALCCLAGSIWHIMLTCSSPLLLFMKMVQLCS